jgi:hypothetical protein
MTPLERLRTALVSADPAEALRATILALSEEGQTQTGVYGLLEELRLTLRTGGELTEEREELLLDLMDAVSGWCHPTARLFVDKDGR